MNNKLEMGIKILDAMDSGDLTLLEELFHKERNIMEVTPVEHWNWLHKVLLDLSQINHPLMLLTI